MPRQIRIQFPGAYYHVMCRGDRREAIFDDDEDRLTFLKTLGEAAGRTGWRVHAYALMGNHYHLLLETPEANLVKGMTWFQATYTVRYNAAHKKSGHLFGGRYKAVLIDEDGRGGLYYKTLLDYLHLNPVRAGLVKADRDGGSTPPLTSYRWTSLQGYAVRPSQRPSWLECSGGGLCRLRSQRRAGGKTGFCGETGRARRGRKAPEVRPGGDRRPGAPVDAQAGLVLRDG